MKKQLIIGALASLVLFSACNDSDSVAPQGELVTFKPFLDKAPRAIDTDVALLQADGFSVFGYHTPTDWATDGAAVTPSFMFDEQVTYTATPTSPNGTYLWEYVNTKYWPANNEPVTFFAYGPSNAATPDASFTTASTTTPKLSYTTNTTIASQQDLVVDANQDEVYSASNGVQLSFTHALSLIEFNAEVITDNITVDITDIQVEVIGGKIKDSGIYTFPNPPAAAPAGVNWALGSTDLTIAATSIYDGSFTAKDKNAGSLPVTAATGGLMLIPQAIPADAIKVTVTFDYQVGGVTTSGVTKDIFIPAITYLENTRYIYNIQIDLGSPIEFAAPTVNAWTDATGLPDLKP